MISMPKSRTSRLLLGLYLVWAYANIFIFLLGGALERGIFHPGHAFYPYTYLGNDGLQLRWSTVQEYDCIELYLYVFGPLVIYMAGRLIFMKGHS